MKKLEEKRVALNKATSMGEAILSICHPDSITTIKHWNTIIKARFEEVSSQLHVCIDAFLPRHSQLQNLDAPGYNKKELLQTFCRNHKLGLHQKDC